MGNRIGVAALVAALGISAVTPVAATQGPSSGAYQTSWNRGLSGWTHSGAGWSASKGVVTYDGSSASVLIAPYKVKSSRYSVTATMRLVAWRETGVSESHGMGILIRARGAVDPTGGTAGLMAGIGKGFVGCDGVHSNAVLATADSDFTTVGQDQRAFSAGHAWHTLPFGARSATERHP